MANARRTPTLARMVRLAWLPLCLVLTACHIDMYDQPRYTANQPSDFFDDGRSMRPPVPNTVAMGPYESDSVIATGRVDGELVTELPVELTADLLEHGQTRYNAYCAPCHGLVGNGDGVIAYRGPLEVTSLHEDRLLTVPDGYMFEIITNGIGRMYGYGARIPPEDRWAVIAYMRALQLSQNVDAATLPDEDRSRIEAGE
jgi:mono/diheme cytochrome c family protein